MLAAFSIAVPDGSRLSGQSLARMGLFPRSSDLSGSLSHVLSRTGSVVWAGCFPGLGNSASWSLGELAECVTTSLRHPRLFCDQASSGTQQGACSQFSWGVWKGHQAVGHSPLGEVGDAPSSPSNNPGNLTHTRAASDSSGNSALSDAPSQVHFVPTSSLCWEAPQPKAAVQSQLY